MTAMPGIAASAALAIVALLKGRRPDGNYYAGEVYGLDAAGHRKYAAAGLLFAAAFGAGLFVPVLLMPLYALLTLAVIFYGASFVRGFSDVE
jgi:hypothetical protein